MNNLTIYHHLGLGDHIICNGLVREFAKKYQTISLFCKSHNVESVRDMYSDLNIDLLLGDDNFAQQFISMNNRDYLIVGHGQLNESEQFDQQFYKLAKVDFQKRWDSFFIPESQKEQELMVELNLPAKYAVVHDDSRYSIDRSKINLPVINIFPKKKYSIPNWRKAIQNAAEVHVIDSSVMFLADSLPENGQKLFVHRYARQNPSWQLPTLKRSWSIL